MATATKSAGNKCLATMLLAKYCYRTLAPTLSGAATTIAMHFTTRMLSNMLLHFAHVLRQFCYCLFLSHDDGERSPIGLQSCLERESLLFQFQSASLTVPKTINDFDSVQQAVFCNIQIFFIKSKQQFFKFPNNRLCETNKK